MCAQHLTLLSTDLKLLIRKCFVAQKDTYSCHKLGTPPPEAQSKLDKSSALF